MFPLVADLAQPMLGFLFVQTFVVGRVDLLIANSQMTRPETRTFGYFGPETKVSGFFSKVRCTQKGRDNARPRIVIVFLCG
jgi:hypothetical protein